MTTKAQLVQERLADIEDRFGPAAGSAAARLRTDRDLPPNLDHAPIDSPERAATIGAYMAAYGNYPPGLSLCDVAGINGDSPDVCLFAGTDDCTCSETGAR